MKVHLAMFNLKDRVTSKKLGLPMMGTVVSISDARFLTSNSPTGENPFWTENYPDWKDGCIVTVKFDKPQRLVSFQEFLNEIPPEVREETEPVELDMHYQNGVKVSMFGNYPEDDLEQC